MQGHTSGKQPRALPFCNRKIGGRYNVVRHIGGGSFGEIYEAVDTITDAVVAVKLEKKTIPHPQLIGESKYYIYLNQERGIDLMPRYYYYGSEMDYNIMVMELLGPSLEDLYTFCGKRFSLKTTLMIADQMLELMEYIHSKGVLHRDIKPDNFVTGARKHNTHRVFVIDFGLAKRFIDPRTRKHIEYKDGKSLTGTARYCSINTHLGIEQSRRDDLEGIGYILIYFLKGSLPWQGLAQEKGKDKYQLIAEAKMNTPLEKLCEDIPVEFATYISYTRCLQFRERPDYGYLRQLFRWVFRSRGYRPDCIYDWTTKRLHEHLAEQKMKRPVTMAGIVSGGGAQHATADEENTIAVA